MRPVAKEKIGAIGLPPRPFLYTLDQIGDMLAMTPKELKRYVWFGDRDVGTRPKKALLAKNIALETSDVPVWRVAEQELLRWLRASGFRVHERGFVLY